MKIVFYVALIGKTLLIFLTKVGIFTRFTWKILSHALNGPFYVKIFLNQFRIGCYWSWIYLRIRSHGLVLTKMHGRWRRRKWRIRRSITSVSGGGGRKAIRRSNHWGTNGKSVGWNFVIRDWTFKLVRFRTCGWIFILNNGCHWSIDFYVEMWTFAFRMLICWSFHIRFTYGSTK